MKGNSSAEIKRIFIAVKIEPGPKMAGMISEFRILLRREKIKWTDKGNHHITLAFLGDTGIELIPSVRQMIIDKCAGTGEFELVIKGVGLFKSLRDPRVIWVGLDPSEALNRLFELVNRGLHGMGIRIDERSFTPHLTIGQIKDLTNRDALLSLIAAHKETEFQIARIGRIILFESVLLPAGPLYKPLAEIEL